MKRVQNALLAGAGLLALTASYAENPAEGSSSNKPSANESTSLEEVIVTARRKEERLQDVPSTVNVATSEDLSKLNIRNFTDVATLMPGLNLFGTNVVNATASVRGITFNQVVSGNSGVIEFYLNDSPVPSSLLYQQMYDIGQIELLRGPQGTLRGRASPAGSMTVTTRRPTLSEWGGYVNTTATFIGGTNINGAVNIPIVNDMLAVRLAALWDENEGDRVRSINNSTRPYSRSKSGRATIRFEPIDSLSFILTYQKLEARRLSYVQVENLEVVDPTTPPAVVPPGIPGSPSNIFIKPTDRLSVQDTPAKPKQTTDIANLQARWSLFGQRLSYVGSSNYTVLDALDVLDSGDFFGQGSPAFLQGYGRNTHGLINGQAHELRLSSEEQIFGMFDYILGAFYEQQRSPTDLTSQTFVLIPAPNPGNPGVAVYTPLNRLNFTKEQSYFGNLTAHLPTGTEISGGFRHLSYKADAGLLVNGAPLAALAVHDDFSTTIYQGSVKQKITDDFMAYASIGTSWRPGVTVVGDFNVAPSPLELSFIHLAPEKSTSYELGVKGSAFDERLRGTLAVYHQTYENNPYRSPSPVFFVNTAANPAGGTLPPAPSAFNLAGAVPVTINGVEAEVSFAPVKAWNMSANATYVKSKIDNGLVPCNDYLPHDGIPDTGSATPTLAQIQAGAGAETITGCRVSYRASQSPQFSGTLQSEGHVSISETFDGYLRGLYSYYGPSQNDPTNPIDDVDRYAILNLYVGIRDPNSNWDVSFYGKNVTQAERVLSRNQVPLGGAARLGANSVSYSTNYRTVSVTAPREFGINVRYSFGSR